VGSSPDFGVVDGTLRTPHPDLRSYKFQTGNPSIPEQRLMSLGLTRKCVVDVKNGVAPHDHLLSSVGGRRAGRGLTVRGTLGVHVRARRASVSLPVC